MGIQKVKNIKKYIDKYKRILYFTFCVSNRPLNKAIRNLKRSIRRFKNNRIKEIYNLNNMD